MAAGAVAGGLSAARPAQPPGRLPDVVAPSAPGPAAEKPYGVPTDEPVQFAHRPSTSCSASSCHGGGAPGRYGSEHSTWAPTADPSDAEGDPHARAYRVLYNAKSVRMGQLLGYGKKGPDGKVAEPPPHQNAKCLACHAVVDGVTTSADAREQSLSEGVGCGGCHGPADKWAAAHVAPGWKALSNEQKWKEYGFVPTKNLVARALNCAGCHVGDGARDMNHDMIAAGHPRLAFEPASFHASGNYRKHWAEKGTTRDFEVRVWAVGKVATLRAAVNLLYERANRAQKIDAGAAAHRDAPWPEFSGYSCYACHQAIGDPELRGTASAPAERPDARGASARRPGLPGWEVWANTGADVAAKACELAFPGLSSSGTDGPKLKALRDLMDTKRAPDSAEVARLALAARGELDRRLAQLQAAADRNPGAVPEGAPRAILARLAAGAVAGDKLADHDWDALAATYLGAASMYAATGGNGGRDAGLAGPLSNLKAALKFPDGANGPSRFGRPNLNTIREQFDLLRATTGTSEGK